MSSPRKLFELMIMLGFALGLYFVWESAAYVSMFCVGFIWNWSASQNVVIVQEGRNYRFSFMKMIYNLHRPLERLPKYLSFPAKILPAGLFWWLVIIFADSNLPFWPVMVGSLVFELLQLDALLTRKSS